MLELPNFVEFQEFTGRMLQQFHMKLIAWETSASAGLVGHVRVIIHSITKSEPLQLGFLRNRNARKSFQWRVLTHAPTYAWCAALHHGTSPPCVFTQHTTTRAQRKKSVTTEYDRTVTRIWSQNGASLIHTPGGGRGATPSIILVIAVGIMTRLPRLLSERTIPSPYTTKEVDTVDTSFDTHPEGRGTPK